MVFDHYDPLIPQPQWPPPQPRRTRPFHPPSPFEPFPMDPTPTFSPLTKEQLDSMMKIIEQFKKAVEAAKTVDKLTGQPDCADPEKEKLLARVAELEKQITKMKKPRKAKKRARGKKRAR